MRKTAFMRGLALTGSMAILLGACSTAPEKGEESPSADAKSYTTREVTDGTTAITIIENPGDGKTLSMVKDSAFGIIEETVDGSKLAFKDMNSKGKLDTWEDWRKAAEERAADLAPQLSVDQISGMMLFSGHERAPGDGLTDAQKEYLSDSHLRNVLYAGGNDLEPVVVWTNQMQAFAETLATADNPYIPVNFSSDPRSDAKDSYAGAEGGLSQWPALLGLAATFNPDTVEEFGKVASDEYRAMGLANALSPQIDLATDPRWVRLTGTLGENADMAAEMAKAYVDGFQTTYDAEGNPVGWGDGSITTVIKHFPGDGSGEGGREAHTNAGKYALVSEDTKAEQLKPFTEALQSGGLMTSYSIILDKEGKPAYGNDRGSAYDKARVDILREANNYDGVIVTDWGITSGGSSDPEAFFGMPWGVDELTVDERHFEVLKTGIDQFGGNNDIKPIQAAFKMWEDAHAAGELEQDAASRWADSGRRILTNIFRVGLYENAYQDLDASKAVAGSADYVAAGYKAQQESVVTLKRGENAPTGEVDPAEYKNMKVYIPRSFDTGHTGIFGPGAYTEGETINIEAAKQYFGEVVTDEAEMDKDDKVVKYTAPDLSDVDMVLVGMNNPNNGDPFTGAGWNQEDNTFYPLSLQYREYTADGKNVRKTSIAGDKLENGKQENRSYFGKSSKISNESQLDAFERAVKAIEKSGKDIPVVTLLSLSSGAVIPAEFEADSDAIVLGMGVSYNALLDVALGLTESTGRLPITLPKNMDTVEASAEDVPGDTDPYKDSAGNEYTFGFGLDRNGQPIK
ncbi:glycoside hydrolase family 3 N-terminal domain-containing protein [Timonella senegalensis]|uniref:glycoside hydrolase family 3 N-terminal domain-containing protein n=1 Tax=Timonella senegalensis TaxID=1465825 RepID=UPI002FDD80D6